MAQGTRVSPAEIQKHLSGVSYPATKQELIDCAKENDASDEVIQSLKNMKRNNFNGPQDVMKGHSD